MTKSYPFYPQTYPQVINRLFTILYTPAAPICASAKTKFRNYDPVPAS